MKFRSLLALAAVFAAGSMLWYVWQSVEPEKVAPVATGVRTAPPDTESTTVPPSTQRSTSEGAPPSIVQKNPAATQPAPKPTPPRIVAPAPPPIKVACMPPEAERSTESPKLEGTKRMVKDYHTMMGENPVGNNADIMKCLMGGTRRAQCSGRRRACR